MQALRSPLRAWWFAPADWWEFWLPMSGPLGGSLMAAFVALVVCLCRTLAGEP
jgi:glycerol uptake facilitator-like aquaporin